MRVKGQTLTDTVKQWRDYAPQYWPLPHPSPRNQLWLKKNSWYERDLVPEFRKSVQQLLK